MVMRVAGRVPGLGLAAIVAVGTVLFLLPGSAMANPQVTMPSSNPGNNQMATVSGSGFPPHRQDPTGLQILECADPGGTQSNLPRDATRCEGQTASINQINTDAAGNFSDKYTFIKLNSAHTSSIDCDATHFCVLWVGVDYNTEFLGPHAFSPSFEIGGTGGAGSSTPVLAIVLPIAAVAIGAGGAVILRRRRGPRPGSAPPVAPDATGRLRVRA
jgi:hypothetical protein